MEYIAEGNGGYPEAVALDSAGNVYITETDYWTTGSSTSAFSQISKYSLASTTTPLSTFGTAGTGTDPAQFDFPAGLVVDSTGRIIVADSNNSRIMILDSSGDYVTHFGVSGTGAGQFDYPMGVAVDGSDNIYVSDTYNGRIQVFSSGGAYLRSWSLPDPDTLDADLPAPDGIAIDSFGYVYVVDSMYTKVHKYTSAGVWQSTISSFTDEHAVSQTLGYVQGIAVDSLGSLYIYDNPDTEGIIYRFTSAGTLVQTIDSNMDASIVLGFGEDLAVDADGNIYVADMDWDRVTVLEYIPDTSDITPPVTTSNIPAGWTQGPFSLALTAVDDSSTVAATYYSSDGTSPTLEYSVPVTITPEGENTITYYSIDSGSNVETPTVELLKIDNTLPVQSDDSTSTYIGSATINLSASDSLSGVQGIHYQVNAGPWVSGTTVIVNTLGAHTVKYYATDYAENGSYLSATTILFSVEPVDDDPPITTSNISPSWNNNVASVDL
jgi:sugar lactone lactonase YvrE